jgi:hypothetical protein
MKVELGQKVQDSITGFVGRVTGRCEYITGCTQVLIQPPIKADGDFVESRWFDEDRAQIIDATRLSLPITNAGPDKPAPRR